VHIRGKDNIVADTLSRIPGSECLTSFELCSLVSTLGVKHCDDLPLKLVPSSVDSLDVPHFINGVISINERESFRDKLLEE
jgi:hypothetical protein